MAEHRGARAARRAARVEEHGERLGVVRRRRRPARLRDQVGPRRAPPAAASVPTVTIARAARPGSSPAPTRAPRSGRRRPRGRSSTVSASANTIRAPGVGDHPHQLAGGAPRVDRYGDHAGPAARRGRPRRTRSGCRPRSSPGGRPPCRRSERPVRHARRRGRRAAPGDSCVRTSPPTGRSCSGSRSAARLSSWATLDSIGGSLSHRTALEQPHDGLGWPRDAAPSSINRARSGRKPARRPRTCSVARQLAGEASAAIAEVETALEVGPGPDRRGVLRRRQHRDAGGLDLPPRPRPAPARVLHHPRHPGRGLEAGLLPRRRGRGPRARRRGPRLGARRFIAGHTVSRAGVARRGDLRRGDGAPDLARHPRARPAPPRPGPAGLAGHRGPDRDRPDHRPPARPDRRAGHRRRARRRRLHRRAGRRDAARLGEGGGGAAARRARRGSTWRAARRTPTPTTTCRCSRRSATRARSTPTTGCASTRGRNGWRIRDYRTGRKAARPACSRRPWPAPWPAPSPPGPRSGARSAEPVRPAGRAAGATATSCSSSSSVNPEESPRRAARPVRCARARRPHDRPWSR